MMTIGAVASGLAQYLLGGNNSKAQSGAGGNTATVAATGKNGQFSLAALQKQAQSVQSQADSAITTGHRERLGTMTDQMSTIVGGLDKLVSGLSTQTISSADLKQVKSTLSSTLNVVSATLSQLSMMAPRGGASAAQTTATLGQLAAKTASLAKQTGISLSSSSVETIVSGISARSPHLVDMLA